MLDAAFVTYAGDERGLIAMRRRHPWLHRAHITVEHLSSTEILYRCSADTSEQLLVASTSPISP